MVSQIVIAWPCQNLLSCVNIDRNAWLVFLFCFKAMEIYNIIADFLATSYDFNQMLCLKIQTFQNLAPIHFV